MIDQDIDAGSRASEDESNWEESSARLRAAIRYWPVFAAAFIVVGVIGYGASYAVKPTFVSSTLFIPPQQQQGGSQAALASLGALSGLVGGPGVKSSADQYISMMQSVGVSDRIIQKFDLAKVYDTDFKDQTRKKLERQVQIAAGKKDGLVRIDVEDADPKRAAAIANQYVAELRILTSRLAITEAQQRRVFFEHLLTDTRDKLVASQVVLESTGYTAGALKAEPKTAAEAYASLRAELTAAQIRLQVMHGSLADTSPEVQRQASTVRALSEQVSRLETSDAADKASPDYIGKYRDFKYQETLFDLYSKQFEIARIDESREGALIQVIDEAQPAERKNSPRRSMFAVGGALIGLLLAAIFAWKRTEPSPQAGL